MLFTNLIEECLDALIEDKKLASLRRDAADETGQAHKYDRELETARHKSDVYKLSSMAQGAHDDAHDAHEKVVKHAERVHGNDKSKWPAHVSKVVGRHASRQKKHASASEKHQDRIDDINAPYRESKEEPRDKEKEARDREERERFSEKFKARAAEKKARKIALRQSFHARKARVTARKAKTAAALKTHANVVDSPKKAAPKPKLMSAGTESLSSLARKIVEVTQRQRRIRKKLGTVGATQAKDIEKRHGGAEAHQKWGTGGADRPLSDIERFKLSGASAPAQRRLSAAELHKLRGG